jgi:DNA polymerase-4
MSEQPRRAWVLHVDLDEFLAAVEVLRRPELRGAPVVVGGRGDPSERGVVSSASYAARAYGIRSGMPLRTALRKCPDATFLPVDGPHYEAASERVMQTLRSLDAVVEVLGWDEAFLGVETDDPQAFAQQIHDEVYAATELHCSVGIGDNKLRAKIATDFGKPRGISTLTEDNWFEVMGERPTDALWGIGRKTATRLEGLGITTVNQLAATDTQLLADAIGPTRGPWYRRLGRGVDSSPVDATPWVPRGRGHEVTFQQDLSDWAEIESQFRGLALKVAADLQELERPALRAAVKVRYVPFFTKSRSMTLPGPTTDPEEFAAAVQILAEKLDHERSVRLIGVRAEMADPA